MFGKGNITCLFRHCLRPTYQSLQIYFWLVMLTFVFLMYRLKAIELFVLPLASWAIPAFAMAQIIEKQLHTKTH